MIGGTPPGRRNPQGLGFHTYLFKHKRCGRLGDYYVTAASNTTAEVENLTAAAVRLNRMAVG